MSRPTTKLPDIEQAAMRLFSRYGIAQVTVKEIAREARCAEGALYRHYSSKTEMAWRLFHRECARFGQRLQDALRKGDSYEERMQSGIDAFCAFFDDDTVGFHFVLLAQHDFPDHPALEPDANPSDIVVRFIESGIRESVFAKRDPVFAAGLVMGIVLQPATMHVYGRLDGLMSDRRLDIGQCCLKVLKSRPGGPS